MKKDKNAIKQGIAEKRWLIKLKREGLEYSRYRPNKKGNSKRESAYIQFPEKFSIYEIEDKKNFKNIIEIIDDIDREIKTKVTLDFSKVRYLKVAAMLILYAAVEKAIHRGISFKVYSLSRENKVNRILKNSGFLTLCRNNELKPFFDRDYMPVVSGVGGQYRDDIVDFIQEKIYKRRMSPDTENIYGGAVHETINNVSYHAYPKLEPSNKKWWVKCDLAKDQLYLAIYDKGVGIPETVIDKSWYWDTLVLSQPDLVRKIHTELQKDQLDVNGLRLKIALGKVSDAIKIAVSMVDDVSGTGETKHGQGSKSIKALVNKNEHGKLWIFSGNGLYIIKDGKAEVFDLPSSIEGTLIQWNIKVEYDEPENDYNRK
ncbi:ATP-binding protein [Providencia rettgeri]|uniref:ATP-binding protein n=1 Tax=Providencia TaxID=586 RepID=UPI001EE6C41A|nr:MULTISPECIES: ATP-binding protein [Providencia]EJD6474802.1 ATP-binding protein [Providencia rettgeri]MCG5371501.1 ATP-binding protein [Providencia rettgeri]